MEPKHFWSQQKRLGQKFKHHETQIASVLWSQVWKPGEGREERMGSCRNRNTENQPGWIRLNIDKHAVAITAALGTREKMNSVCAQSFLCALEDKPLDEEKEYYKSQTKGHWSQGYVPRKKTLWNLCKRVKNHSEQRIDSKLIPNCSVIIEVSGLCLPGLKAAAEMDRTFPPLFPSSGSADLHSHGHGDPSSSQGAVSSQSEWHRVLGESKHPTVRSDQSSATGDGQPGALERLPSVNGQQPEKDRARQDRGSAPGYFAASS